MHQPCGWGVHAWLLHVEHISYPGYKQQVPLTNRTLPQTPITVRAGKLLPIHLVGRHYNLSVQVYTENKPVHRSYSIVVAGTGRQETKLL